MKKNIILLGSLILSSAAYSQVGIDTHDPKATLDVVVTADKLNKPFGIIAPRVTGTQLRNAGGQFLEPQDGAIVYATSSAETTTGRAKNVTQKGYYYYDWAIGNGSTQGLWVALKNAPAEYVEPWAVQGDTTPATPATANNQAIYQSGAVSIWRNKVFESTASGSAKVDLHVNGATRIGATDPAVTKNVGASSFAGGNAAVASGDNSMAYGTSVEASGDSSSAFGNATIAIGSNSIAMGDQSIAVADNSAAFGFKTNSSAINSLSIGNSTAAIGVQSFAGGINSTASGENSLAMGKETKATAFASASFGELSEANSNYSISAGYYNQTENPGEAAFGVYNKTTSGALFTVGDGAGSGASNVTRSNIISAQKASNGNFVAVGSGTAAPSKVRDETLRVYGGALANKAYVTDINSVTGAATDKIVVADATTGQLKTITASTVVPAITSDNGLTKTANNVQLGGNLTKVTSIGTNSSVTLGITGLQTGAVTDKIVVASGNEGVLKAIDISSLPNSTYKEPWNQAGTTTPATANHQAIYQKGAVSIWRDKVFESIASGSAKVDLHVNGATRIGATDPARTEKVGASSFAGGSSAVASGNNSMAYGTSVEASGDSSSAFGNASKATGRASTALGEFNEANGYSSVALGNSSIANGKFSVATGVGAKTSSIMQTAVGSYNYVLNHSEDVGNSPTSYLFMVGDGYADNSRSNIIVAQTGGGWSNGSNTNNFVAIGSGTAAPSKVRDEKLRVYGGTLSNKAYVTDINSVTGTATDKVVVADGTTGQLKTISATGASVSYKEPWKNQTDESLANDNGQNLYQSGAVAIMKKSSYSNVNWANLDVNGAVRFGTNPTGKVGANSAAFGNTAEASGIESFAAGSTTIASGTRSFVTGWETKVTGDNSAGFGKSNTVSGVNSVAMGNGSKVETNQSFAGGTGSTVTYSLNNTGDNSIAFGEVAQAVAASSAAFGKNTIAGGEQSLAFGNGAWATGDYSLAGGQGTKAIGNNSVAFGNSSLAQGKNSFAFTDGLVNQGAVGDYSFAFGNRASTRYNHGVAMGIGTVSPVRSGVTFGRFNSYTGATQVDGTPNGSNAHNSPGDPIFQVGQGGDDNGRSNIITGFSGTGTNNAYAPGWVVIGSQTTSAAINGVNLFLSPRIGPSATLSVYGDYASNGKMNIDGAMRANGGFYSSASQTIYPDYVFENYADKKSNINATYKMMSLSEVDSFIKTNKHLPGVTGINELPTNENGHKEFELSKLSTQTLEKVEELYLHTIEQQKQIDELKDIVKQQQKQIDQLLKK